VAAAADEQGFFQTLYMRSAWKKLRKKPPLSAASAADWKFIGDFTMAYRV
jgi:hypothetical protein